MIDLEPHSTCVWWREGEERKRQRDIQRGSNGSCMRVWFELAAVQLHPRRVRRKARIFSSVTHLGRWAWLTGRERREGGGERGRDIGRSAFVHARCKAAFTTRRGEESWRIWFVWFFGRVRKHGGERRSWSPPIGLGR